MSSRSSRRRPAEVLAGQEGMTLVELTVSMVILSLIVATVFGVLFSVQAGVERQIDTADRNSRTLLATQAIDREMRSAYAMTTSNGGQTISIYTANNLDVRYQALTGAPPVDRNNLICTQFKIEGETLYRRFWIQVDPWPGGDVDWLTVVTGVGTNAGAFEVDPDPIYDGSLLAINLSILGDGDAVAQESTQFLHGANVTSTAVNPCDEVTEQPDNP